MKLSGMKNIAIIFTGLLFLWYSLNMTGFAFNNIILVTSAIKDEPIDIAWWVIFIICFALFLKKDRYGKYALSIFLILFGIIQFPKWFTTDLNRIESYNNFFGDEGTHYIIAQSKERLIKDTYHIIIDILIFLALIANLLFVIKAKMEKSKERAHCT